MLSTFVKVSAVTNLNEARYCAGMGVEMIGFAMDEQHPDYLSAENAQEIASWLAGVQVVGETASNDAAVIQQKIDAYRVNAVQVEAVELLDKFDIPTILKTQESDLADIKPEPFAFVISAEELDEWTIFKVQKEAESCPILLECPFDPQTIKDFLGEVSIKGIVLNAKDDNLMDILEALEVD